MPEGVPCFPTKRVGFGVCCFLYTCVFSPQNKKFVWFISKLPIVSIVLLLFPKEKFRLLGLWRSGWCLFVNSCVFCWLRFMLCFVGVLGFLGFELDWSWHVLFGQEVLFFSFFFEVFVCFLSHGISGELLSKGFGCFFLLCEVWMTLLYISARLRWWIGLLEMLFYLFWGLLKQIQEKHIKCYSYKQLPKVVSSIDLWRVGSLFFLMNLDGSSPLCLQKPGYIKTAHRKSHPKEPR